jgi:hypothetical protein
MAGAEVTERLYGRLDLLFFGVRKDLWWCEMVPLRRFLPQPRRPEKSSPAQSSVKSKDGR